MPLAQRDRVLMRLPRGEAEESGSAVTSRLPLMSVRSAMRPQNDHFFQSQAAMKCVQVTRSTSPSDDLPGLQSRAETVSYVGSSNV